MKEFESFGWANYESLYQTSCLYDALKAKMSKYALINNKQLFSKRIRCYTSSKINDHDKKLEVLNLIFSHNDEGSEQKVFASNEYLIFHNKSHREAVIDICSFDEELIETFIGPIVSNG